MTLEKKIGQQMGEIIGELWAVTGGGISAEEMASQTVILIPEFYELPYDEQSGERTRIHNLAVKIAKDIFGLK